MKITIIGAGNGGQAMAGHFSMLGHRITLFNRESEKTRLLAKSKEIILREALKGSSEIHCVTSDLRKAIEGAELIMITTTANVHREFAQKIAPFLEDGQFIVLNPGRTLGALEFSSQIKKTCNRKVYVAEAQSLIYACRAESPGNVRVIGIKDRVFLAAYPSSDTEKVIRTLNKVYPCFVKASSILHTSLENIGAILHPAVIIFNAAAIERGNLFYFYNDMTPAIANFLENLDYERILIGKAFNVDLLKLSDWVSYAYEDVKGLTLLDKIRNNPAYFKIQAPTSLYSRLLMEDVPTGILPMIELARMANLKTPLLDSILNVSQALLGTNFCDFGRTLKNLGLEGMSIEDFKRSL